MASAQKFTTLLRKKLDKVLNDLDKHLDIIPIKVTEEEEGYDGIEISDSSYMEGVVHEPVSMTDWALDKEEYGDESWDSEPSMEEFVNKLVEMYQYLDKIDQHGVSLEAPRLKDLSDSLIEKGTNRITCPDKLQKFSQLIMSFLTTLFCVDQYELKVSVVDDIIQIDKTFWYHVTCQYQIRQDGLVKLVSRTAYSMNGRGGSSDKDCQHEQWKSYKDILDDLGDNSRSSK